jgi:hypothetical protein
MGWRNLSKTAEKSSSIQPMRSGCNIQCEDLVMLRLSDTKSSMLANFLSAGVALWVILDELLDKTTVQGRDGRSAVLH